MGLGVFLEWVDSFAMGERTGGMPVVGGLEIENGLGTGVA